MPQLTTGSEKPRRWVKRYRTEVSASSASVLSTVSAFPLDSVKTRLQTYPYNGFLHCVRETYQSEGLRGFFRGKVTRILYPVSCILYPISCILYTETS